MEKDNEINVNGGSYDFGARIYDSRLGRWLSLDPLAAKGVGLSPYNFCFNNTNIYVDSDGNWPGPIMTPGRSMAAMFQTSTFRTINFIVRHPIASDAIRMYTFGSTNISTNASRFSTRIGLIENDAREGSQVNAFRHTLWQAAIAARFGRNIAKEIADAHEENPNAIKSSGTFINSFKTLSSADEAADLQNNMIGRNIGTENPNDDMQELSIKILNYYKENGLYVAEEIKDKKGNVTGYKIVQQKLSESQYNNALKTLLELNSNGRTDNEQKSKDDKNLSTADNIDVKR
jgi:RHS repeat-associated protein